MSCCAHRGVDPRPLGRSYAVVSVPLSHGHVYVVASTASKPLSYVATLILLDLTRSSGFRLSGERPVFHRYLNRVDKNINRYRRKYTAHKIQAQIGS